MLHATEAQLRRLEDEPLAIPDRVRDHIEACRRCRERLAVVMDDAERCARLFAGPRPLPDVDAAWARFQKEREAGGGVSRRSVALRPRRPRVSRLSLRGGLAAAGVAVALAGTAAAATLTGVFAPTHVAPLTLSRSDVRALADFMGLGSAGGPGGGPLLGGFSTANGSVATSFGRIQWSSSGTVQQVSTLSEAESHAGFAVTLPATLPAGVAGPQRFAVQPRVEVTVTFDSSVPNIGGSSVVLDAGPAVLAAYGSAGGPQVPTLGILTMPRPTAVSSGAQISQIEAFLLGQPGIPPELAQEIRLLGGAGTTLPIPVPSGASERSVEVSGSPGVLVSDSSNAASGVVWEDSRGTLRAVAGLLDPQDILDVAGQLG